MSSVIRMEEEAMEDENDAEATIILPVQAPETDRQRPAP